MSVMRDTRQRWSATAGATPELERAWASLVDHADDIADDIAAQLLEREREWYDVAGPEIRADLRASTREHVRVGLRAMAGQGTSEQTIDLWRDTGRKRARQGIPLELVLNAYTVGTRVLWEALVRQQTAVGLDDHLVVLAARRIWSNLDIQNSVMSAAYREESDQLQRRDLQRQGRLLDALVEGRGSDPTFAAEVQEVLGVAVDEPLICAVAAFDGERDSPLRRPDDRLEQAGLVSFWHVRGDHHFGLVRLGGMAPDRASALVGRQLSGCATGRVGLAPSPEGLTGFCTAFQLALHTLETVPRGTSGVAAVEDRLPQVLLAASPAVTALLVRRTIGAVLALPDHQSRVLLQTLRALIDHHGSQTHAAEQLYCHRNTVIYRMRQLQELTGRSLADPGDRLLLSLALMALDR